MPVERIAMLWNSLPLETDPESVVAFVRAVERFHGITRGVLASVAPSRAEAWSSWDEAERISNAQAVEEAIGNLLKDQTGDNATCLVRAVLEAARGVDTSRADQLKGGA
jgi:hypothetical protein